MFVLGWWCNRYSKVIAKAQTSINLYKSLNGFGDGVLCIEASYEALKAYDIKNAKAAT